jgi:exopolyphosphatase/guanosine-5'-triphosphate,3'-diphosphate pyrophosphatase
MEKMKGQISSSLDLAMVLALRLAVLFHRSRSDVRLPPFEAQCDGKRFQLGLDAAWLAASPLTAAALMEEVKEWRKLGVALDIAALKEVEVEGELLPAD